MPKMIQHQRAGPDGADGIGDAPAGNVRRRSVDRLEHRRVAPRRIDVRARRDAKTAGDGRTDIGKDVAEQVRRDDDVERLWMRDHARRQRVDVVFAILDRRIVLPHRLGHFVPEHHRVRQRIRLGGAGEQAARPPRGQLETVAENPFDAVAGEHAGLLRHFVIGPAMNAAADAGVLAF